MTPKQMAKIHALSFKEPRPWSVKEFADLLASPHTHIVTSDNGFAFFQIAGPEAELLTIAVHPGARRNGEGSNLLKNVLGTAEAAQCEEIFLEVVEKNEPAISLYHAYGFENRGTRKDYYNGPNGIKSHAVVMHKKL